MHFSRFHSPVPFRFLSYVQIEPGNRERICWTAPFLCRFWGFGTNATRRQQEHIRVRFIHVGVELSFPDGRLLRRARSDEAYEPARRRWSYEQENGITLAEALEGQPERRYWDTSDWCYDHTLSIEVESEAEESLSFYLGVLGVREGPLAQSR